jgi:hypothetical protein
MLSVPQSPLLLDDHDLATVAACHAQLSVNLYGMFATGVVTMVFA